MLIKNKKKTREVKPNKIDTNHSNQSRINLIQVNNVAYRSSTQTKLLVRGLRCTGPLGPGTLLLVPVIVSVDKNGDFYFTERNWPELPGSMRKRARETEKQTLDSDGFMMLLRLLFWSSSDLPVLNLFILS